MVYTVDAGACWEHRNTIFLLRVRGMGVLDDEYETVLRHCREWTALHVYGVG
jgi:hypothetical protein